MSLAAALAAYAPGGPRPACTVCRLLTGLSSEDRVLILEAFDDDRFTSKSLERILRGEGHHVGSGALARHRRGDCRGGTE